MWKSLFDFFKQVLRLTDEMQSVKGSIKQLEKRDVELSEILNRLAHRIDRLEEKYALEQEILLLKLENRVLRELKGLPSANSSDDRSN